MCVSARQRSRRVLTETREHAGPVRIVFFAVGAGQYLASLCRFTSGSSTSDLSRHPIGPNRVVAGARQRSAIERGAGKVLHRWVKDIRVGWCIHIAGVLPHSLHTGRPDAAIATDHWNAKINRCGCHNSIRHIRHIGARYALKGINDFYR